MTPCTLDPEVWFTPATVAQAKRVCGQCPRQQECAQWAIDHPDLAVFGVWGGLDELDRELLHKRRPPAGVECGTNSGYRAHKRRKTAVCQPCRDAHAAAARAGRGGA